jgi:DNA-binding CsgD family transcriptional regulator
MEKAQMGKRCRDTYHLWDRGLLQNEEIGRVFGISYSAVSHIVKDVKERMKKAPQLGSKVQSINSQFKI